MPRQFRSEICCLFGQPVAENPTQVMIEAAFGAMGLDWRYLTIEVAPADLPDAVRGMRAMGFRGGNCTIPHKVAVVKLLGENTDGKGFLESVQEHGPVAGKSAVLLGAGGAARAIGVELLAAGAGAITVVNRGVARGQELV